MTITTFRIYYQAASTSRERKLTRSHWGFATWFKRRLKPIREQLGGPEAEGVDIVNLMLYENPEHAWQRDKWAQRLNSFEFSFVCDLKPLLDGVPMENVEKLMVFSSEVVANAPWPQVRALSAPLSKPLTDFDKRELGPYLQWPRPESLLF
jgi:hypothetical protein